MNDKSMIREIARLKSLPVADLQAEWLRLYGEPSRSRNRDFLWKRLAWRIQELDRGGLSRAALDRVDALAPDGFERARSRNAAIVDDAPARLAQTRQRRRDARLPVPGSVICKLYRGRELRVVVREDGLELDGVMYPSATALAKAITGSKSINGWLFLGVTERKR